MKTLLRGPRTRGVAEFAILAACALVSVSPAFALTPLGPGVYTYFTEVDDPTGAFLVQNTLTYPSGGPQSQNSQTPLGSTATSSSVDSTAVTLSIAASATAIPDTGSGLRSAATAETNITFYLTAHGQVGTLVPVHLIALLQSSGQEDPANEFGVFGMATGFAELVLNDNFSEHQPDYYTYAGCRFQGCVTTINMPINTTINLRAEQAYQVQETVLVIAAVLDTGIPLTSTAFADPHFSIPTDYLLAHPDASLQLSPGLQPLTAVPEPSSWALMLLGFGFAGAAARQRRALGRPRSTPVRG